MLKTTAHPPLSPHPPDRPGLAIDNQLAETIILHTQTIRTRNVWAKDKSHDRSGRDHVPAGLFSFGLLAVEPLSSTAISKSKCQ
jgi:hypothetical protein